VSYLKLQKERKKQFGSSKYQKISFSCQIKNVCLRDENQQTLGDLRKLRQLKHENEVRLVSFLKDLV
jgi:hypothetical protein